MEEMKYFANELEEFLRKGESLLEKMHQGGMMGHHTGYNYGSGQGQTMDYRHGGRGIRGEGYVAPRGSWPMDPRFM